MTPVTESAFVLQVEFAAATNVQTIPPMDEIANFPSLERISADSRSLIERTRESFEYAPRRTVIHCGEVIGGTYFITHGHFRAFIQNADGRERTLYHVHPGQTCILAVNCTFSGVVYPAWVAAADEPTRGFFLPAATYRALFEREPEVRNFTIGVLTSWIYDMMTRIEETSLGSMSQRIAHVLVRRANHEGVLRGTHQDLATDLGTAREVVSRHLKEFESMGLISKERRQIRVLDRRRLLSHQ